MTESRAVRRLCLMVDIERYSRHANRDQRSCSAG